MFNGFMHFNYSKCTNFLNVKLAIFLNGTDSLNPHMYQRFSIYRSTGIQDHGLNIEKLTQY